MRNNPKNNSMLPTLISRMLIAYCLSSVQSAQAASFDCGKAGSKIEHIICDNPEISKLDDELNTAYKVALQNKQRAVAIKQAQRQWILDRNVCMNVECVKRVYESRISTLRSMNNLSNSISSKVEESVNIQSAGNYHFHITKGSGVPVCDAYLERLNSTSYDIPPACTRPESDKISGFAYLNRINISSEEAHSIVPRIWDYWGSKHQGSKEEDEAEEIKRKSSGLGPKRDRLSTIQSMIEKKEIVAWHYSPPVDIDNDGTPDNILMWQGYGLLDPMGVCGVPVEYSRFTFNGILKTAAFIEADNKVQLDTDRTMAIFGHPSGGYRFNQNLVETKFRAIGPSMGIFKYQGLYYFDTFFDWRGDFQNLRQKDEELSNTLGVFLRQNNKTEQICEYRMTDNQPPESDSNN